MKRVHIPAEWSGKGSKMMVLAPVPFLCPSQSLSETKEASVEPGVQRLPPAQLLLSPARPQGHFSCHQDVAEPAFPQCCPHPALLRV